MSGPFHPRSPAPDPSAQSSAPAKSGDDGVRFAETGGGGTDEETVEFRDLPISGWVFDGNGVAVSGINLTALPLGAENSSWPLVSTRTDSNGHFEFSSLRDGVYDVRTQATGRYKAARAMLRGGSDAAVLVLKEKETQRVTVFGKVSASNGSVISGVRVVANGQAGQAVRTDENGAYELDLNVGATGYTYIIRFLSKGHRPRQISLMGQDFRDRAELRRDVVLKPTGGSTRVTGTITGLQGLAVSGASIQLFSAAIGRRYHAVSDQDGDYAFAAVEKGDDYRLWVRPKGLFRNHVEYNIEVGGAAVDLPVVLQPLRKTFFKGRLVDTVGDPIAGVKLWARIPHGSSARYLGITTDGSGRFRLDGVPEGEISFTSRTEPRQRIFGAVAEPGGGETRLTMESGDLVVSGFVTDGRGDAVGGARVTLSWFHDEGGIKSYSTRQTATDRDGYFLFTRVGVGVHRLSARAQGFRPVQFDHPITGLGREITVRLERGQTARRASRF